MRFLVLFFMLVVLSACGDIKAVKGEALEGGFGQVEQKTAVEKSFEFFLDGEGGLFRSHKWRDYQMLSHTIWSKFHLYSIKTPKAEYKLQILDYHENGGWGEYRIRFQERDSEKVLDLSFSALPCGTKYSHPLSYSGCVKDPLQNQSTYIDLDSGRVWRMQESEALKSKDWDLSFNSTDIKLNGGISGPSKVVGAILKDSSDFYKDFELSGFDLLQKIYSFDKGLSLFESFQWPKEGVFYFPEDGVSEIIHGDQWQAETVVEVVERNTGFWCFVSAGYMSGCEGEEIVKKVAKSSSHWLVEYGDQKPSYVLFKVFEIIEDYDSVEVEYNSKIIFSLSYPPLFNEEFYVESSSFSSLSAVRFCLSLTSRVWTNCDAGLWDIEVSINKRDWKIKNQGRAAGPFGYDYFEMKAKEISFE